LRNEFSGFQDSNGDIAPFHYLIVVHPFVFFHLDQLLFYLNDVLRVILDHHIQLFDPYLHIHLLIKEGINKFVKRDVAVLIFIHLFEQGLHHSQVNLVLASGAKELSKLLNSYFIVFVNIELLELCQEVLLHFLILSCFHDSELSLIFLGILLTGHHLIGVFFGALHNLLTLSRSVLSRPSFVGRVLSGYGRAV